MTTETDDMDLAEDTVATILAGFLDIMVPNLLATYI